MLSGNLLTRNNKRRGKKYSVDSLERESEGTRKESESCKSIQSHPRLSFFSFRFFGSGFETSFLFTRQTSPSFGQRRKLSRNGKERERKVVWEATKSHKNWKDQREMTRWKVSESEMKIARQTDGVFEEEV